MSDIELNPTGEMLLDCMDKLERTQTKNTALVEAVRDFCAHAEANVHEWENYNPLTYLVNEEEVRHLQLLLVTAQKEA